MRINLKRNVLEFPGKARSGRWTLYRWTQDLPERWSRPFSIQNACFSCGNVSQEALLKFWDLICEAPWTSRSNSSIKRKNGATEPSNWIPSAVSTVPAKTVRAQLQRRPQEGSLTRSCPKHSGRRHSLRLGNDQPLHSLLGNSLNWEKVHSMQATSDAKLRTWNLFKSTSRTKLWWNYR